MSDAPGRVCAIEEKRCPRIATSCSLVEAWKFAGPLAASRFGSLEFLPVPYLVDSNAYGIGHVFVPVTTETGCFGSILKFKLIGTIGQFLVKSASNPRWYQNNFPAVKTNAEHRNLKGDNNLSLLDRLKVKLGSGNREIVFTASNCYYLSKPESMVATRDVTIDRSSHEDLTDAKWIGLITEVVASDVFQMQITAKLCGRTFYVGDNDAHAFLFKYEICKLDETGNVCHVNNDTKQFKKARWEALDKTKRDKLPLSSLN